MASLERVLLMVLLGSFCYSAMSDKQTCKQAWQDFTDAISRGTHRHFVNYIDPLAQMTKKAYTGEVEEEIPLWKLIREFKLTHGLYALAYQSEDFPNEIVVAFRGIQFGTESFEGMRNDLCARYTLLAAGDECSDDKTPLPDICKAFKGWQLDYLNQARIFVSQLRTEFEEACIMYTGHSYGATLAALMSADSEGRSHAIGFSANPSNLGEIAADLDITSTDFSNVITIYDKYDSNAVLDDSTVGITCRFEDHPEPEACATCAADGPFPDLGTVLLDMTSPCGQCLHATHKFGEILGRIYSDDSKRPQCYEQGWVQIPYKEEESSPSPTKDDDTKRRLLLDLLKELNSE